jgi:hypothetical protein
MVFFLLLWFSPYFLRSRFFVWVGENATCNPQLSQKSILEGDTNASVRAKLGEMPPREIEQAVGVGQIKANNLA